MDDAARLVSELHAKLAELDAKVAAYRRGMLAEFHRHMDACLKAYPDHVSNEVSRVIAQSMSEGRYPALSAGGSSSNSRREVLPDSPTIDRSAWDGRGSPPPILPHTSGTPKEGPRGPHAREREFQGLFTPTYLPLLESNDRAYRSPPTSPPPPPSSGAASVPLSVENVRSVEEAKGPVSASHAYRPGPVRRLTDRSTSSVDSSGSESKVRRSALRRSSGSNKDSPRRVRFEFHGEEVFPSSSSPQASSATLTLVGGAGPQPAADASAIAIEIESTVYAGTSLLDVEGEEDSLPRPIKVSSTQALQALTRSPLEEGTVWTVVNPDPEEPAKMNDEKQAEKASSEVDPPAATLPGDGAEDEALTDEVLGSPIEELGSYENEDDEDASDDEFLSMKPKRKTPSPVATTPFPRPPARVPAAAPTMSTSGVNGKDINDDHDPIFDFEEEEGRTDAESQTEPQKYLSDLEDDEVDDIQSRRLRALSRANNEPAAAPREWGQQGEAAVPEPPPVSPSAVLFAHSVGSYMGRSLAIEPIRDPKLYDEIATMEDVHFFVGSVVDGPANLGSYRAGASLARTVIGEPRSFSERLALEEEMERRRAAGGEEEEEEEEEEDR